MILAFLKKIWRPKRSVFYHKNILIVDDDRLLLKMVSASLAHGGFGVLTAKSGEAGIALARKKKPDLIILDVLMPGLKGRQVCARLKSDAATRHIPIIFLTAKDSIDDVQAEISAGAVAHLTKPVDPRKLLSEIKNVLGIKI